MSFTDSLESSILDHIFGGGDYSRPATLQVGLSTTAINDDGTGITEPAGGDYARVALDNDTVTWDAAIIDNDKGLKTNAIDIEFPEATDTWGTIVNFFIADNAVVLGYGPLAASKEINVGDIVRFKAGELKITLD